MSNEYFVRRNRKVSGPHSLTAIRAGLKAEKLSPTDHFSNSSAGPWQNLAAVKLDSVHRVPTAQVKKSLFGRITVRFRCPVCNMALTTGADETLSNDQCPQCDANLKFDRSVIEGVEEKQTEPAKWSAVSIASGAVGVAALGVALSAALYITFIVVRWTWQVVRWTWQDVLPPLWNWTRSKDFAADVGIIFFMLVIGGFVFIVAAVLSRSGVRVTRHFDLDDDGTNDISIGL